MAKYILFDTEIIGNFNKLSVKKGLNKISVLQSFTKSADEQLTKMRYNILLIWFIKGK